MEIIKHLPKGLFQGIPGLNLDLGRESYYRVNIIPSFINMRTPNEKRDNVNELMQSVGLDYYDRFECLLRSEIRCGNDNLFVVRKPLYNKRFQDYEQIKNRYLHPGDIVELDSLNDITSTNAKLVETIFVCFKVALKYLLKVKIDILKMMNV